MTRKSIAIDMDEVLADTVGALIEDVNKRTDLGITYDMLDGKKLRHAMPEHDGLLHEILREPGFFKKLKVMAHSQKVVKKLTEHYDVFIATAAMDVPTSFHDKYAWLREYFPFLDPQHFVFCGRKDIVNADYLIDDNPRQLAIFTGKSIMYTASHNVNDDRFTRVNNWYDVEQYFLGDSEYNI
ncbi:MULTISPECIES: 5' nucleotidase, NT5C type [Staphylococcus]|jgi:5'(3')-deoxyribonucleotidase|uniref:Putative 5'(3')-deoxyribonucleotidase n=1 Tax=Staphylococcus nepalensis TaxID=214473 RepID=A0A291JMY0_9STAP|nr:MULTISPECIES: 5'(3')-deoxyribonucleotidase [Staphylococcus]VDG67823.1 Phage related protein [Lacrimispora indolis]ATH60833.1 5'(3')-deoxyribonucleotidase [Staphylococcus nepalensis]ATH65864.1 5'(3')-deoxyribonucleotidase [Staphylococcus nepalensis]AWI45253.1 5'(3')-deoxyribonucleotidase [Staphylococcus nepalensis]MBO1206590.1 5'(3')-deoxyribonucleotidase [Staphylococcus nepalensis]